MKDFQTWYDLLIADSRWYEQVTMKYKGNFQIACEKLYGMSVSDPDLFARPIQAQRTHLFNMLWKMPMEKKNWVQTHQVEEKKEDPNYVPLTGEARKQRLNEFLQAVQAAPIIKPVRKLTSEQLEEEGQVRPKSVKFERSEIETRLAAIESVKDAMNARRKVYKEAFPDSSDEEIYLYIMKFSDVDNPDGLTI